MTTLGSLLFLPVNVSSPPLPSVSNLNPLSIHKLTSPLITPFNKNAPQGQDPLC